MEDNDKKEQQVPIIDQVKEYLETYVQLARLKAIERGTAIMASIVADLFVMLCLSISFLFALVALALYLSELFGSFWKGFGTVALICFFIVLMIRLAKKSVERPIINILIKKLFK